MVRILSERYRWHVAYKCPACEGWAGVVALGWELTDHELKQWFSCPVHRDDPTCQTAMYRMDRNTTQAWSKKR